MNNSDFWTSIDRIIQDGFTDEGLKLLDYYAEQFISGRIVYKRFSPSEQHGCAEGGPTHVIASLLAAAEIGANLLTEPDNSDKRERQQAEIQSRRIEDWARIAGCWIDRADIELSQRFDEELTHGGESVVYDNGTSLIKTIRLDYFIEPVLVLDRISLHNAWFPETRLSVLGFGRDEEDSFVIIVEQPYIRGTSMTKDEIREFALKLGFKLYSPRSQTYATNEIYLSDLHGENVIKSAGGNIFVLDCDIRINIPALKCDGKRTLTNEIANGPEVCYGAQ